MKTKELVSFEINHFRKEWGKKLCFNTLNETNINNCLTHALSDALNQGARRNGLEYKSKLSLILYAFCDTFLDIGKGITKIPSDIEFKNTFEKLKTKFYEALRNNGLEKLATFGFAQKFISMSFKYIYCFDDCQKYNLRFCYLPLDRYTIDWYKQYGDSELIKKFKKIKFAWSNIDENLFFNIQNDIDKVLRKGINYPINCKDKTQTVVLPKCKIEVEFIVWKQQKITDIYNLLVKDREYYERLGIKEI